MRLKYRREKKKVNPRHFPTLTMRTSKVRIAAARHIHHATVTVDRQLKLSEPWELHLQRFHDEWPEGHPRNETADPDSVALFFFFFPYHYLMPVPHLCDRETKRLLSPPSYSIKLGSTLASGAITGIQSFDCLRFLITRHLTDGYRPRPGRVICTATYRCQLKSVRYNATLGSAPRGAR
ncbi:hypothetical protein BJV78DRAFT_911523 [Lactifluus subvellereus]|nr:hypothetical protein BJV78DRAFT_911523 [Lactifluus subvellereus]